MNDSIYIRRSATTTSLTQKLVTLFLLVTGQRGQAVLALDTDHLVWSDQGEAVFTLTTVMKTARVGEPLKVITIKPYYLKEYVCVVSTLKEYLRRTAPLRKEETSLMISIRKPHGSVTRDTVSRWVLQLLTEAGINTEVYKLHSTRGASTSAGAALGLSSDVLMRHGSWKAQGSMARFYNKPVDKPIPTVGDAIRDELA